MGKFNIMKVYNYNKNKTRDFVTVLLLNSSISLHYQTELTCEGNRLVLNSLVPLKGSYVWSMEYNSKPFYMKRMEQIFLAVLNIGKTGHTI